MKPLLVLLFSLFLISGIAGVFIYLRKTISQEAFAPISYMRPGQVKLLDRTPTCIFEEEVEYYEYRPEPNNFKNNKFGIYIYAENAKFFELAQQLVNSNGGDWGYVLIPYNISDTDGEKWERVFEQLREKRLIPVVQLYTSNLDDYKSKTDRAARFLNNYIWPIKERYISVYNEMNDANFWFGYVDAKEYARVLDYTIDAFKKVSENYKLMNGAFNVSALTGPGYIDAFDYMQIMNQEKPGIFDKLDYWASHPYPQPAFVGFPTDKGRNSIRAYEVELQFLRDLLGVKKDLKVFITETGWPHAEGVSYNSAYLPVSKVADNFKEAFEKVWLPDDRVLGVMPFTIWYREPFDHFAWVREDLVPYEHYEKIKEMDKIAGTPERLSGISIKIKKCE